MTACVAWCGWGCISAAGPDDAGNDFIGDLLELSVYLVVLPVVVVPCGGWGLLKQPSEIKYKQNLQKQQNVI